MPKRKGTKRKAQQTKETRPSKNAPQMAEDDEEIDEDLAFDAKDEEKYGHLFQDTKSKQEDEDEGDDDFDDDGPPKQLSDLLDEEPLSKPATKPPLASTREEEEEEENEDGDDDEEEEDEGDDEGGDEEDNPEAHAALMKALGSLDRKPTAKKAKTAQGMELLEETEFAANGDDTLNMQDLMGSLSNLKNADLKKLKLRLLKLNAKKIQPVEVPLEEVHKNAVERKVTYETVKQEISRWASTVAKNRRVKTLVLPLNEQRTESVSSASLQANFKPSNNLEKDLQNILEQYGYTESALRKREEHQLEQRELSPREIQEKQRHLAQLKSLLFYHEIKQKRLKKIKSKQYRKLKKKREEGKKLTPEELARLNPGEAQDQQMAHEAERIKERMTQKHKNTSKWAKKTLQLMKNQRLTGNLSESRKAIEQQLTAHQKLSRKSDATQEESSEEDSSDGDGDGEARFKAEIAALQTDDPDITKAKGVAGLKFMQRGMEKRRAETAKLLEDALAEDEPTETPKENVIPEAKSRRTFTAVASLPNATGLPEDGRIEMLSNGFQSAKVGFSKGFTVGTDRPVEVSLKPSAPTDLLFEVEEFSDHETEKKKIIEFTTPVIPAPKSILKRKVPDVQQAPIENEETETKNPWQVGARAAKSQPVKLDANNLKLMSGTTKSSKFNLLDESSIGGQEKLVKEAFSLTGEAEQMFRKEKNEIVTADLPKFEDYAVPGWGRWGHAKSKPRPLSKMKLKIKAAIEKKAAEEAAGRQDAKLSHVIISQKTDKKSLKYMVPSLPYPYTSVEQYDKAQRTPVGTEWNTQNTFQHTIKPSVITKPGAIIEPITRKYKGAKHKKASSRNAA